MCKDVTVIHKMSMQFYEHPDIITIQVFLLDESSILISSCKIRLFTV